MKTTTPWLNNSIQRSSAALLFFVLVLVSFPRGAEAADTTDTAYGNFALYAITTGKEDTAIGYDALRFTTDGLFNTGVGAFVLHQNVSGQSNTAVGDSALYNNTGSDNTAIGDSALYLNTSGNNNTATGESALQDNMTGSNNTANGFQALHGNGNITGNNNTATGSEALAKNAADNNTATGSNALLENSTGTQNSAHGAYALEFNDDGNNNTATGFSALNQNNHGYSLTASGAFALYHNSTGFENTATGWEALFNNTAGSNNTAEGFQALLHSTGSNNIALGSGAGSSLTTGNNNIDIGALGSVGEANTIRIGKSGTQNKTFIAGISGKTVASGVGVIIAANGQLGTVQSSARYKDDIRPMATTSESILKLKPVTFRYKQELDPDKIPQFGLVAEDVEKVNRDLVVRDEDGKVMTVRYEAVNAMLLNEFLKEHRKVAEHQATIDQLKATATQQQKQIEALTAGLQKVTAQVAAANSLPRVVSDN